MFLVVHAEGLTWTSSQVHQCKSQFRSYPIIKHHDFYLSIINLIIQTRGIELIPIILGVLSLPVQIAELVTRFCKI